ncbi:hypothetical protein [Granulicella aggregans]|uniref:hypothetical protein n=1 Tax=Granulicella aggregans TaxID=474949 RepID=UPI001C855534|nr:hypothetical protein [Granulicella aggregans]
MGAATPQKAMPLSAGRSLAPKIEGERWVRLRLHAGVCLQADADDPRHPVQGGSLGLGNLGWGSRGDGPTTARRISKMGGKVG